MNRNLIALFAIASMAAPAAFAADEPAPEPRVDVAAAPAPIMQDEAAPATYDVFIDGVTAYAFIRTPQGWKFVRSLKDDERI